MNIHRKNFSNIQVVTVGKLNKLRGYSAFKFIPNTNDKYIIATKTAENPETREMQSYVTG